MAYQGIRRRRRAKHTDCCPTTTNWLNQLQLRLFTNYSAENFIVDRGGTEHNTARVERPQKSSNYYDAATKQTALSATFSTTAFRLTTSATYLAVISWALLMSIIIITTAAASPAVTPRLLNAVNYPPITSIYDNNNNNIINVNNNNIDNTNLIRANSAAGGSVPVIEPDYSSYLHWYYYFSPITLSWLSSNIVPDLIAVPPPLPLLVGFDSKAAVYWGNELTPSLVRNQPVFLHWPTQPGALYTLVMADPDVIANDKPAIVHWAVVNIPNTRVDRGDVIVEYLGSGPDRGTGKHRYVLLVFKQTSRIHTSGYPEVTRRQFDGRRRFDLHHFTMHFKLGYPIAGNFYLAEYDDYVPFIFKQIGMK